MTGSTPSPLVAPDATDVSPEHYGALRGCWTLPSSGANLVVEQKGDALYIEREQVYYQMMHVVPSAFYVPGLDVMVGVSQVRDRSTAQLHVSGATAEERGRRTNCPAAR